MPRLPDSILAWYFVLVWGSGFLATKIGLQDAASFAFLCLRFGFGLVCLLPIALLAKPRWPASRAELGHVLVASWSLVSAWHWCCGGAVRVHG